VLALPAGGEALVAVVVEGGCVVVVTVAHAIAAVHPFSGVAGAEEEGCEEEEG
jgi:hypothetical protein